MRSLSPPPVVPVSRAEGGDRGGAADHHAGAGGGDRLLQALHVAGHQHHDQEAAEVQTRRVLLPRPAGL